MLTTRRTWMAMLLGAALSCTSLAQDQAEIELRSAVERETLRGDLKGAIEQYRRVAATHKANRAVAAKALLRLGQAYEKLGDAEAQAAYQQLLRLYGDQSESASAARARLAALRGDSSTPATRRLYTRSSQFWQQGLPSSDGRFHARDDDETSELSLHDLQTGAKKRLTNHFQGAPRNPKGIGVVTAIFTPDNQWIIYTLMPLKAGYEMRMIRVDGTGDRLVYRTSDTSEAAWLYPVNCTPDGSSVLVTFNKRSNLRLYHVGLVGLKDGKFRTIRELEFGNVETRAMLSPDGRFAAFDYVTARGSRERDIAVIDLQSNQETPAVRHAAHDANPMWTPDGKAVVFESDRGGSRGLWRIPFEQGKPVGDPELIRGEIQPSQLLGFDRRGVLYYGISVGSHATQVAEFDDVTGRFLSAPKPLQTAHGNPKSEAVSPDGRTVAYLARTDSNERKNELPLLVLEPVQGGADRRISLSLDSAVSSIWLPDGSAVVIYGFRNKPERRVGHLIVRADTGDARWLPALSDGKSRTFTPNSICATSNGEVYHAAYGTPAGADGRLFRVNTRTGESAVIHTRDQGGIGNVCPSPDGKWVAFTSWMGNDRDQVFVLPAGGEPKLLRENLRSKEGFIAIGGWSSDSRWIYYYASRNDKPGIWRLPVDGGEPELTQPLPSNTRPVVLTAQRRVTLTVDLGSSSELWAMEGLLPRR